VRYTLRNFYIDQSQQTPISIAVFLGIICKYAINNAVKRSKSASQMENQAVAF
jgi:hypothetical protein